MKLITGPKYKQCNVPGNHHAHNIDENHNDGVGPAEPMTHFAEQKHVSQLSEELPSCQARRFCEDIKHGHHAPHDSDPDEENLGQSLGGMDAHICRDQTVHGNPKK